MMNSLSQRPVVLVCYDRLKKFTGLVQAARQFESGRLLAEFEFVFCDSLEAIKRFYNRGQNRYVALIVLGVDFSEIDNEQRLVSFPFGLRPFGVTVDIRQVQGFIIYQHIRQSGIDRLAPVLFQVDGGTPNEPERFLDFVHCPDLGGCIFLTAGPVEESLFELLGKIDCCALRPLSQKQRLVWQERHKMVVGRSRRMAALVRDIERIGPTEGIVLILGPQGSGKELVAAALHRLSHRYIEGEPLREKPVVVNIGSLDHNLVLDEIFGHVAGAYTDAKTARAGIFETANGSTVFIDEIGDSSLELQAKLLRVIEYRLVKRLGSSVEKEVDVRILAATNKPINELQERFRPDFYSRLVQQCLMVPSLQERWEAESAVTVEEDIADFFDFFVGEMNRNPRHRHKLMPDPTAIKFLTRVVLQHIEGKREFFSGNVRTLRALIERSYERAQYEQAKVVGIGQVATAITHFQAQRSPVKTTESGSTGGFLEKTIGSLKLSEIEKEAIREALMKSSGNQSQAAALLGIHRDTLRKKMKEYRIEFN